MSGLAGGWSLQNPARPCTGTHRALFPLSWPYLAFRAGKAQQLAPGLVRQVRLLSSSLSYPQSTRLLTSGGSGRKPWGGAQASQTVAGLGKEIWLRFPSILCSFLPLTPATPCRWNASLLPSQPTLPPVFPSFAAGISDPHLIPEGGAQGPKALSLHDWAHRSLENVK